MNPLAFLTPQFWIDRDKRQLEEQYEQGWNWAAGNLLRGESTERVLQHADAARDFDCETVFDVGVRAAVEAWQRAVAARALAGWKGQPAELPEDAGSVT